MFFRKYPLLLKSLKELEEKSEVLYKEYLKENNITHNKITILTFDKSFGVKYQVIPPPKGKLLFKECKELKSMTLLTCLKKIAEEVKIFIDYNSNIIKGMLKFLRWRNSCGIYR